MTMLTYQQWRATVGPLMSKLYAVTGVELHESYKRYAEERREVLSNIEEIWGDIF